MNPTAEQCGSFPAQLADVKYWSEVDSCKKTRGDVMFHGSFGGPRSVAEMPAEMLLEIFTGPIAVGYDIVNVVLAPEEGVGFSYRSIRFDFINKLQQKLFEIALKDVPRLPDGFIQERTQAVKAEAAAEFVPVGVEVVRALIKHLDHDTDLVGCDENALAEVVSGVLDARGFHGPVVG